MSEKATTERPNPTVMGFAWHREVDWPRIKELFPDANELRDSYAEWLKFAESQ